MTAEVDAETRAHMLPHLEDSFAYWLTITEQASFEAPQAETDLGLGLLVTNRSNPFRERHATV